MTLILVGLVGAELLAARAADRTQVVRPSGRVRLEEQDGVPIWYVDAPEGARREDCAEPRVMIFGTSVLAGIAIPREAVFSESLRDLGCIENHAVPAYAGETMLARARRELPGSRPDVVIWEVSGSAMESFTWVGRAAYNLKGAAAPAPWVGHLVSRSRLLERLWLDSFEFPKDKAYDPVARYQDTLTSLMALATTEGAQVGVVFAPPLDRPFATIVDDRDRFSLDLQGWLTAHAVPWLDLATALSGEDVVALRLDTCCHFNAAGHARIGAIVKDWVRPWVAESNVEP
ncbi:MAG: SGNH/GDSL hydrolase family protein [Myxococcota bacterium]